MQHVLRGPIAKWPDQPAPRHRMKTGPGAPQIGKAKGRLAAARHMQQSLLAKQDTGSAKGRPMRPSQGQKCRQIVRLPGVIGIEKGDHRRGCPRDGPVARRACASGHVMRGTADQAQTEIGQIVIALPVIRGDHYLYTL